MKRARRHDANEFGRLRGLGERQHMAAMREQNQLCRRQFALQRLALGAIIQDAIAVLRPLPPARY
ncbi:hypothetical protein [Rhodoblastus sp.]|uniref:hypothetical protein n=1 Tax=Rhodoblastus sp. TaxID=1962975 RepID=UPI003F95D668